MLRYFEADAAVDEDFDGAETASRAHGAEFGGGEVVGYADAEPVEVGEVPVDTGQEGESVAETIAETAPESVLIVEQQGSFRLEHREVGRLDEGGGLEFE